VKGEEVRNKKRRANIEGRVKGEEVKRRETRNEEQRANNQQPITNHE
jgi:hypothetical protein